ncbi:MAG TPA: Ig-like domain-containing protein, partial [Vicinamibacterales bacterium]
GGVDTSAAQTFVINVTPVNDPPSFTKGPDESVSSDAGLQTIPNWATNISAGPANESSQTVSFIVTNDNNAAFTSQPAVSSSGTLTFNTAVSAPTTTVHVNVTAQDNGGTANGGVDTSATQSFNINITHANQPPVANPDSYDAVGNTELAVGTAGTQAATLSVATGSVLANDTDSDGDPLTATLGTVSAGASVTMNSDGTFRYLPPAGFSGDDTFTYVVNDGHGHNVTGTVTIHVIKRVLYVKNNGGGTTGRVDSPYTTLAAAQAASADNDTVYVFTGDGTTTGQSNGFTINHNGERMIGEGVALNADGIYNGATNPQLRAAGTAPHMSNTGNGVTIAKVGTLATAEVSGVNIAATTNGVSVTNASNVTMNSDTISATTGSGVTGTQVATFTLNGSTITAPAGSGVAFDNAPTQTENNLSGAVSITNNTISTPGVHGIRIQNYSGTISNLAVTGNAISSTTDPSTSNGSGIAVLIFGNASASASVTKGSLNNNTISNFPSGAGIQFQSGNSTSGPSTVTGNSGNPSNIVTIDGNTITGNATNHIGTDAILVTVAGKGDANVDVSNNGTVAQPITNTNGAVIALSVAGNATVSAAINNNVIVANNNSGTGGIVVGVANLIAATETPSVKLTITGNSISATDGTGLNAVIRNCSGSMSATITNNTVAAPLSGVRSGIRVDSGSAAGNTSLCLQLSGNTSAGSGGATGIGLRKQGTNSAVNVYGIVGMAATSSPGVQTYVNSQNPAGGGTTLVSASSGFTNCSL